MKKAAFSVFVDAIILVLIGSVMMLFPAQFLTMLGFALCEDLIVARTLGLLVLVLSIYYMLIARADIKLFVIFTVVGRLTFFLGTVVFFVVGWTGPNIFLISIIDLAGSLWTLAALKGEGARSG